MTHEELLKSIEFGHTPLVFEALWKVARLHKPVDTVPKYIPEEIRKQATKWCAGCYVLEAYPCPTIQMIESVLPLVNLSPDMA